MKKLFFTFYSILFLFLSTQGQVLEWAKQYKGVQNSYGKFITADAAGNVYTAGTFEGVYDFDPGPATLNLTASPNSDGFICKMDDSGNLLWVRQFSSTDIVSIYVDNSGFIYTTGSFGGTVDFDPGSGTFNFTSFGSNDIFILKLDGSGDFAWAKQMGGHQPDLGNSIKVDAFGNIYLGGHFEGNTDFDPGINTFNLTSFGNNDVYIAKLDAAGNFIWAKQLGGYGNEFCYSITLDGSGNVFIAGAFEGTADFDPGSGIYNFSSEGYNDVYITKLDAAGDFVWAKKIGGTSFSECRTIALDALGNIYTSGVFQGDLDVDPGVGTYNLTSVPVLGSGVFISKLDQSGNFVWGKQIQGGIGYEPSQISLDASSNVYTTGCFAGSADFDPGSGNYVLTSDVTDTYISKLDASGNFIWAMKLQGSDFNYAYSIFSNPSGTAYIIGIFEGTVDCDPGNGNANLISEGWQDIYVLKLDGTITSTIPSHNQISNLRLIPNPTEGQFKIDLGNRFNYISVKVRNIDGQIISEQQFAFADHLQLNIDGLPGIYIVEVKADEIDPAYVKVVKK
jgi:hypothetical protein